MYSATQLNGIDVSLEVCDGAGDPCDAACGGAGCGTCGGGVSCDEGAVTKSIQAVDLANQSQSILVVTKREIDIVYNSVSIYRGFFRASFSAFRPSLKYLPLLPQTDKSS